MGGLHGRLRIGPGLAFFAVALTERDGWTTAKTRAGVGSTLQAPVPADDRLTFAITVCLIKLYTAATRDVVRCADMDNERTTLAVEHYLIQLANLDGDSPAEPIIRALIARSVERLHLLCRTLLVRSYPRLMRPPLNLQSDEMLSAVVDRLIKAMRELRPTNVRQFFALANQHMRWELNDLARRLDSQTRVHELNEAIVVAPENSGSQLSPNASRMLAAIEELPDDEREVFDLVRIQGLSQTEVADLLDVSPKTIQRRLNRSIIQLTSKLCDLNPVRTQANDD